MNLKVKHNAVGNILNIDIDGKYVVDRSSRVHDERQKAINYINMLYEYLKKSPTYILVKKNEIFDILSFLGVSKSVRPGHICYYFDGAEKDQVIAEMVEYFVTTDN